VEFIIIRSDYNSEGVEIILARLKCSWPLKEKCKTTEVCEDRSAVSKKIRTKQVGKVEEEAHIPSSPCQQVMTETEKMNKSKLAKVEENWVSRYKTLVPQLFTDISFRCLGVAATVHAPYFLPTCLPLAACRLPD